MAKNTYTVGQIIFIVSQKTQQIIPVQVVKRIVESTFGGEELITYKVVGPQGEGPHDLSQIDGEIYTDSKVVRDELRHKATNAVDKMVDKAVKIASDHFKQTITNHNHQDGLVLKQSTNGVNGRVHEPPTISLEEGEIELPPGPDGVPRKGKIRHVIKPPQVS